MTLRDAERRDDARATNAAEFDSAEPPHFALWDGDSGRLLENSRRALVQLLRGPYVSASRHAKLWSAILGDEAELRSRLNELFLDLVIDTDGEVAFVRNVDASEIEAPKTVRTASLTFFDTALLLQLRQQLLASDGSERVIVGRDEIDDQMRVYAARGISDEKKFSSRVNSSWTTMEKYGFVARTPTEGRFEVSPVLRIVFGADEVTALQAEYRRIAENGNITLDVDMLNTVNGIEDEMES